MKTFALWLGVVVSVTAGPTLAAEQHPLRPFVRGTYRAIVEANAEKPLVVSFWSITCPPCIAEMPMWRDLQDRHPGIGLALVSTDSFEDEPRIRRALKRYGLGQSGSWVFDERFVERLRADVDRSWMGELPRTYLIGRDGRTVAHSGMIEPPVLRAWLGEQVKP